MRAFAYCCLALSTVVGGCASNVQPRYHYATPIARPGQAAAAAAQAVRFRFQVGDEMEVSVWKEADLTTQQRIQADGTISPKLLKPVPVVGLTVAETQDKLAKAYTEFMKDPKVSVRIVGIHSDRVFVIGEVRAPQAVPLSGPMNVLESVALAGGFLEESASKSSIRVVRKSASGTPDVLRLDGDAVLEGRSGDFPLERGDIVFVPAKGITQWARAFGQALAPVSSAVGAAGSAATVAIAANQLK